MRLLWEERAWEEYCLWQAEDKKTLKRINLLIKDIQRGAFDGTADQNRLREISLAGGAGVLITYTGLSIK